ncbi:hypothetical protein CBI33_28000 [Rhodococcus erythropolis]|nr:hypothetical protein CBI33_28000 [Rhodococcus erythropolis]
MAPRNFRHSQAPVKIFSAQGWHSGPLIPTRFSFARRRKKWRGMRPGHFHSKGNDMQNIRLRTATDVLAAIPALLGFVPANSVVMIALTGSPATLAFIARTDVIGADAAADYSTALEQAAATSVIWVVVGAGPVAAAGLDQIEAAQRELDSRGIHSIRTLVAESLEIGAEWFDTNGEESGRTADPILSEVSMNRIMSGRQTSSSRAEIEARYREGTPPTWPPPAPPQPSRARTSHETRSRKSPHSCAISRFPVSTSPPAPDCARQRTRTTAMP